MIANPPHTTPDRALKPHQAVTYTATVIIRPNAPAGERCHITAHVTGTKLRLDLDGATAQACLATVELALEAIYDAPAQALGEVQP